MTNRLPWSTVVLLLGILAIVGAVLIIGKPIGDLLSLVNLLLTGFVYARVEQVQSQTNGTLHRTMSIVEKVVPGASVQATDGDPLAR